MATRLSTVEVLEFIPGDEDFGLSDCKSSEDSDGAIHAYRGSRTLLRKSLDLLLEKLFLNKDKVQVMV